MFSLVIFFYDAFCLSEGLEWILSFDPLSPPPKLTLFFSPPVFSGFSPPPSGLFSNPSPWVPKHQPVFSHHSCGISRPSADRYPSFFLSAPPPFLPLWEASTAHSFFSCCTRRLFLSWVCSFCCGPPLSIFAQPAP